MGFTLAPRDFNDSYTPIVTGWLEGEREQEGQQVNDTQHPTNEQYYDLSISTFMDDIAKITMLPFAARKKEVVEQLNLVSGRLEGGTNSRKLAPQP
eukprot:1384845-Pyramimonas_sp.AAC.1